jgi:hypothetical protein
MKTMFIYATKSPPRGDFLKLKILTIYDRMFRRYKQYYNLLSAYPRFRYTTISFNSLKDKIPMIEKYFKSQICIALPLTDICSRYFWKTIPQSFHNFDSIKDINNDDSDSLSNEDDLESNSGQEDNGEDGTVNENDPLTSHQFLHQTHWYTFKAAEYPLRSCGICVSDFVDDERITVLECHHQYHEDCVREWITSHNALCPTCRRSSRENSILADAPVEQLIVFHTPFDQ